MKLTSLQSSGSAKFLTRSILSHFPKIELHRHLEGTFDLPTLHSMALRNGIDISKSFDDFCSSVQFPPDSPPDFLVFLSKFRNDWYRSHDDVAEITYKSIRNLAKDGIHYIEMRFSPEHFCLHNNFDRMAITRLIITNGNKAANEAGFKIRYLITFNRGKQKAAEMLQLYNDLLALELPEIVGIDLAGDELNFPPHQFESFFKKVKDDKKYGITIHAGEVTPSQQIWDAIQILHADRIGHGTSTITDPKLQKILIENKITLEQCITSNYQTGSWHDPENHPLGRLFRFGVPTSINTDDPHIQNCDLTDEYIKVIKYFDFSLDELEQINRLTIDGTFLPVDEKAALHKSYDKAIITFKNKYL